MSKAKYKVEVIVEVENDDWNNVGHDRVKRCVKSAVTNALDDAYENGFHHPAASFISIKPIEINVL